MDSMQVKYAVGANVSKFLNEKIVSESYHSYSFSDAT